MITRAELDAKVDAFMSRTDWSAWRCDWCHRPRSAFDMFAPRFEALGYVILCHCGREFHALHVSRTRVSCASAHMAECDSLERAMP